MSWKTNIGERPIEAKGKRVKVKLRNGMICGDKPVSTGAAKGWPADDEAGRGPCNWRITGSDFDIAEWDFA